MNAVDRSLSHVEQEAARLKPPCGMTCVRGLLVVALGLALAVVVDQLGKHVITDYAARLAMDAGIMIILAVSLNIVNGLTGQFSIGHAGFFAIGGYTAAALTYYLSMQFWDSPARHEGWFSAGELLFVGSCIVGGLVGAGVGFVMGLPALRLRGDYLAIVTLGFGEIIRVILQQTNPVLYTAEEWQNAGVDALIPPPVGGSLGFSGVPKYTNLFWVYAFVALTLLVSYRLKYSSIGRGLISIREDEIAARAMGVHITRWKVRAFVIAAFFAGIAGGLFAHESGVIISPKDAAFARSIEIVIMVVLGGKGSLTGVVLSATILSLMPELLRDFEEYRMIVYALLLIGMMLLRPQGLLGSREIWDLFKRKPRPVTEGAAP